MNIQLDDGVQFGLGMFETILMKHGKPVLLDWHLERLNASLAFFGIEQMVTVQQVEEFLQQEGEACFHSGALKLLVTEKNRLFLWRQHPYTKEVLDRGFSLDYSPVLRNETSVFTYHKTLNYGDNILAKRGTREKAIDEVVFLNSRGEICEGSTTNIFFVKDGTILTPAVSCGLLPGVMRRYILENSDCQERILYPEDVEEMEECFVTNSLMGVMPVRRLGNREFRKSATAEALLAGFHKDFTF
ncbi:MAG: aminotransferase class IV [Lachnospiraceae bacterium]|nr:aminotransferase class IV [Lachnospiraceae bacterium]